MTNCIGITGKKKVCWRLVRSTHGREKIYLRVKLIMLKGFHVSEFVISVVKTMCLTPYTEFCYVLYVAFFL